MIDSGTSTIRSSGRKSFCPRSTRVSLALITLGRSFLPEHQKPAQCLFAIVRCSMPTCSKSFQNKLSRPSPMRQSSQHLSHDDASYLISHDSSSRGNSFTTFNDDYVIQRAITGFRQCATIASTFHLPEVFDHIVMALSQSQSFSPIKFRPTVSIIDTHSF